jgi:predicted site-specific integrase-resolvase
MLITQKTVSKKVKKGMLKIVPCKIKKSIIKKELVEKQTRKTEAVARHWDKHPLHLHQHPSCAG